MRMIFETDIENFDYIELILSKKEYLNLEDEPLVQDFYRVFSDSRNLNVMIRVDPNQEEEIMPLVKGKAASTPKGFAENVRREKGFGKKTDQAVAIAYGEADRGKKMDKKKHK